ncbi:antirestriction protein ArdA [Burkholderia gladioli]|uniref:antirestriction protein ArdA n=1 Tax=Burkholderia gladioli TaxID=28095 RepID=UPI00163FE8C9|nr:antirestriction protein ArdA [Burkholderia gladioli]
MTTLHAQPYNLDAVGFYFDGLDDYNAQAENLMNRHGCPVEEFEIQFIDGERADAELFEALGINQVNLATWFDDIETLDEQEKAALFYLVLDLGYTLDDAMSERDDVTLYEGGLLEAATELFDELYLHDVPVAVRCYIDYEAFARDCRLNSDMTEFEFGGTTYTVTNAAGL